MSFDFAEIYNRLYSWCEAQDFAGYDPFDGLNSKIFQRLPIKYFRLPRLFWLQMVKRSSLNLRPFLLIHKDVNPKGIALLTLAELSRFRTTANKRNAENTVYLADKLLSFKVTLGKHESGSLKSAFGYNFDWQSRVFFAKKMSPAVVPTAFAAKAFVEAYRVFKKAVYLETAQEISNFIAEELDRIGETDEELCFSYIPNDQTVVYNAGLLAAECLADVGALNGNQDLLNLAEKCTRFVIRRQRDDGSWEYGAGRQHNWVDNFHTAYVLLSLFRLSRLLPELKDDIEVSLHSGYKYWTENLFLENGMPKYYDSESYPVDIHSAAAAIAALSEMSDFDGEALPLAEKIANWTSANMLDENGYFYYQMRRNSIVKTPFMRWGQSWMAFALQVSGGKQKVR